MRGHEALQAMRRRGKVPAIVFVATDRDATEHYRNWPADTPDMASILVERSEAAHRLDLRCLVGLTVCVSGCDEDRVGAVALACERAKALRVIAVTSIQDGEGVAITTVTDTSGVLTCPT